MTQKEEAAVKDLSKAPLTPEEEEVSTNFFFSPLLSLSFSPYLGILSI